MFIQQPDGTVGSEPIKPLDPTKSPLYSAYQFSHAENRINFGIQPLYMPTGLISECLKRDKILKQALKRLNSDIQFYAFLKGDDLNYFFKKNDLQIGIAGDMPTLSIASLERVDVLIPLLVQQGFVELIANRAMLLSELKGKRIGYAYGSNAHLTLLKALASENFTEQDVKLIPMDLSEMPDALANHVIDLFSAWQPIVAIARKKHQEFVPIFQSIATGYLYLQKDMQQTRPEQVLEIVTAVVRAVNWLQQDRKNLLLASDWLRASGAALQKGEISLSAEEIAELAMRDIIGAQSDLIIDEEDLQEEQDLHKSYVFLKSLGRIAPSSHWEKVKESFDRSIIEKVLKDKGRSTRQYNYSLDG